MNAFFIKNRLHDYVDGTLPEETKVEIDQAIVAYPDLLIELEQLQQQRRMMLDHGRASAPPQMLEDIWSKLESEPLPAANQSSSGTGWWTWSAALAVMMLAWWLIPQKSVVTESQSLVKGAQSIPKINPVQLPTTSPIERSARTHSIDLEPVVPVDDTPEVVETSMPKKQRPTPKIEPSKPPSQTFVIQTPDTPYFTEYEQDVHIIEVEGAHPEHDDAFFSFAFAPSNILHQLNSMAMKYNGQLLSNEGVELTPYTLSATKPSASVDLHIPVEMVSKANDELRQLGGRFSGETIDEINGHGVFKIQITHQNY